MCDLDHAETGSSNSMQRFLTAPEFAAFCAAKTDVVEVTVDEVDGVEDLDVVEVGGESSSSSEL